MARPASSDPVYLQRLQAYYAEHRMFPSYAGIGEIVGLSSTSSVAALLRRLQAGRYIEIRQRRILPLPRFFERPLLPSRVAAGLPAAAYDAPADGLDIDTFLVRRPARTFLLQVKGESMTGAGLLPGDTVVVEARNAASPGDIVIAQIDGEHTIKRLAKDRGRLVLRPENPDFPVLTPDPLDIVGVVVGAFRRYY